MPARLTIPNPIVIPRHFRSWNPDLGVVGGIDLGSESRIHVPDELWVMLHEGLITCIGYLDP